MGGMVGGMVYMLNARRLRMGCPALTFVSHRDTVVVSTDGSRLYSDSGDSAIRMQNTASGEQLLALQSHTQFLLVVWPCVAACWYLEAGIVSLREAVGHDRRTLLRTLNLVKMVLFGPLQSLQLGPV
jgi:hypothetical protein